MDLRDGKSVWKPFHVFRSGINEGDHFVISEMIEIALSADFKAREQQVFGAMRTGTTKNQTLIAPGGSAEYYAELAGNRATIETSYNSAPLWMKAKTFWPLAPFPLHLVATLRGALFYSDGKTAKSVCFSRYDVAMRFPLQWKIAARRALLAGSNKK